MLQSTSPVLGEAAPFALKRRKPSLDRWVLVWLGREALAFPVWAWAFWGGANVQWRGRRFKVGVDMRVRETGSSKDAEYQMPTNEKGKVL